MGLSASFESKRSAAMRIYLWQHSFLLQADSYVLRCVDKPYRRLSATLIIANRGSFRLRVNRLPEREYQGVLLGPDVQRESLVANQAQLSIADAGLTSPLFAPLAEGVARGQLRPLSCADLATARSVLAPGWEAPADCARAWPQFKRLIQALSPPHSVAVPLDARLAKALALIERLPFDQLGVRRLAAEAGVSEPRLRALTQQALGCSLTRYMRWCSAYKLLNQWQADVSLTELAHRLGFHDLAHLDHTVHEFFGMSPSEILRNPQVRFIRCA